MRRLPFAALAAIATLAGCPTTVPTKAVPTARLASPTAIPPAQASGAKVLGLANAGADTVNSIKQAAEFGLTRKMKIAALLMYAWGLAIRMQSVEGLLAEERDLATFLASPDTATIVLAGTEQAPPSAETLLATLKEKSPSNASRGKS